MRVVTELLNPPRACLVTGREDGEFCDFETDVICDEYPHVYIKRDVVESAARELGMAPAAEVEAVRKTVAELGEKVAEVQDALDLMANFEEQFNRLKEPA